MFCLRSDDNGTETVNKTTTGTNGIWNILIEDIIAGFDEAIESFFVDKSTTKKFRGCLHMCQDRRGRIRHFALVIQSICTLKWGKGKNAWSSKYGNPLCLYGIGIQFNDKIQIPFGI